MAPAATARAGQAVPPGRGRRTFASPGQAFADFAGVALRAPSLASVYLRGRLDPECRERVMVAVSRANSCRGCTRAHERWAISAGVTSEELQAIGLGDLAGLDDRNRAAIVYATALAEGRFREPLPADLDSEVAEKLTASEVGAVEAVARAISLANLSANTAGSLIERLRSGLRM